MGRQGNNAPIDLPPLYVASPIYAVGIGSSEAGLVSSLSPTAYSVIDLISYGIIAQLTT
jgi:hypothetical protein